MLDPSQDEFGCRPINIGTGNGSTVLEMVAAMEKACGHKIATEFAERREGDTEAVWAAPGLAEQVLGWKARFTVEDMCRDQWNWARRFPRGYEEPVEMMRPHTLPRDLSFDVFNQGAATAAVSATESAAAAAEEPGAPTPPASTAIATEQQQPGADVAGSDQQDVCEKRAGIFREVHEVNLNGIDGVQLNERNGIRGVGGTISKVSGGKARAGPATTSPAGKPACAVAQC